MKIYTTREFISGQISEGRQVVRWMKTGEFRPPKKGEHYLSGNPAQVWDVPNDLSTPFHIMEQYSPEVWDRKILGLKTKLSELITKESKADLSFSKELVLDALKQLTKQIEEL